MLNFVHWFNSHTIFIVLSTSALKITGVWHSAATTATPPAATPTTTEFTGGSPTAAYGEPTSANTSKPTTKTVCSFKSATTTTATATTTEC